ncbi:hypothetical protein A9404_05575 [Halothiobacillus diazotrophicus]|uniref:Pressure-regulated protein n=1 Tax=Halothiobacillus diazotrophicus TaxID=1860122 RepID=A0A191ZGB1_9GAMM|nr:DUF3565 domain-containing protein [Halothiobacillus diazotrophicus]ANJ66919.1 hypothetical protein A9404_05575 [Halothiobacillus diazotrophicus]
MVALKPFASPQRAIHSFHRDVHGDWYVKLECGHHQHTRHNPPWINRAWVENSFGRMAMLGTLLPCPHCARLIDTNQSGTGVL